jgi:ParB family chromosome partitioning protein
VVKQRLRLVSVSEKLLEVYAEDGMTLEQLMAFTVTTDHARQEQVWEALQQSYDKEPYLIRRLLTESAVRGSDRRARFVGIDAYEAAGGCVILRDLFEEDGAAGCRTCLARPVGDRETGKAEAEKIAAEGWKWIEVAVDFRYGHMSHLRQLDGVTVELTPAEQATRCAARRVRQARSEYAKAPTSCRTRSTPAWARSRRRLQPSRIGRCVMSRQRSRMAGVFVSIDADGRLLPIAAMSGRRMSRQCGSRRRRAGGRRGDADETEPAASDVQRTVITIGGSEPDR